MPRHSTNISVRYRMDDDAVVISTDAYVSHKKQSGPWTSTFSMQMQEARELHVLLGKIIDGEHCTSWAEAKSPPNP